jgi:very-short-patch-repair endonuclease
VKKPPDHSIAKRDKELRQSMTAAERRLWHALRNRQIEGAKFRRQTWIGPYIADFVCLERKLIVEADGMQHHDQAEYDHHRNLFLETEGFCVLRFWNSDILTNMDGVLTQIRAHLIKRPSPSRSPAASGPLPLPQGERA